jgi:hypothetical protein
MLTELLGIISVDFDFIGQILRDILHLSNTEEKMGILWGYTSKL